MSLITAHGLTKGFGARQVLRGVELELGAGQVYGLVGRNGAGKTTLIRILLGLLRHESGKLRVLGHEPWRHSPEYYHGVGTVLEHDGFFGNLTFVENMRFFARAKGIEPRALDEYLEQHWATTGIVSAGRKVRFFSRGQRMQCALCRAFLGWPRVCYLDEPTVGLDIDAYDHFRGLVREARARGAAVLISSHQLDAVEELCDVVGVLADGVLRPLARAHGRLGGEWLIVADGACDVAAVIRENGGVGVAADGEGWRFTVDEPERVVPALVAALVGAECRVQQVRPIGAELRERLRRANDEQRGSVVS